MTMRARTWNRSFLFCSLLLCSVPLRSVPYGILSYRSISSRLQSNRTEPNRMVSYGMVSHSVVSWVIVSHRTVSCGIMWHRVARSLRMRIDAHPKLQISETGRWLLTGGHIVRDAHLLCDLRGKCRGFAYRLELGAGFYEPSSGPSK